MTARSVHEHSYESGLETAFDGTAWSSPMSSGFALDRCTPSYIKSEAYESPFERRNAHGMAQLEEKAYLFGGQGPNGCLMDDMWMLDTNCRDWKRISPSGEIPCARYLHTLTADPERKRIWLYGGMGLERNFLDDLWAFDPETCEWEKHVTTGKHPNPRALHSAEYFSGKLFVFGGLISGARPSGCVWILDIESMLWSCAQVPFLERSCPERPRPRFAHHCAFYGSWMYVAGGYWSEPNREEEGIFDIWRFSAEFETWEKMTEDFSPTFGIGRAKSVSASDRWLFVGGGTALASYDFPSGQLSLWDLSDPLPSGLYGHAACFMSSHQSDLPPQEGKTGAIVVTCGKTGGEAATNCTRLLYWCGHAGAERKDSPLCASLSRQSTSRASQALTVPSGDSTADTMSECSSENGLPNDPRSHSDGVVDETGELVDELIETIERLTRENDELKNTNEQLVRENRALEEQKAVLEKETSDAKHGKRLEEMKCLQVIEYAARDRSRLSSHNQRLMRQSEKWKCSVCYDTDVSCVLLPCRHMTLCHRCSEEVLRISPRVCPVCREGVEDVVVPFFP